MKHLAPLIALVLPAVPVAAQGDCLNFEDSVPVTVAGDANFALPAIEGPDGDAWLLFTDNVDGLHVISRDADTGTWAPAVQLSTTDSSIPPDLAVDSQGNLTAVWVDSTGFNIFESRYQPGSGWGAASLVLASPSGMLSTDLGTDVDDNVLMAFRRSTNGAEIAAMVRSAQTGLWGPVQELSDPAAGSSGFSGEKVARNDSGTNVSIVYASFAADPPFEGVWIHEWDPVTMTFSAATMVPGTETIRVWASLLRSETQILVDESGERTVVWQDNDFSILTSQTVGGVWQPPVFQVGGYSSPSETTFELSASDVTPDGEVVVSLTGTTFNQHDFWVLRFDPQTGWDTPRLLDNLTGERPDPLAVFYRGDRAVAVLSRHNLLKAWHFNGSEWSEDQLALPHDIDPDHVAIASTNDEFLLIARNPDATAVRSALYGGTGFSKLAFGLAGTYGIPVLEAECDQAPGEIVTYRLTGALENSVAFWVIGTSAIKMPLFPGILLPSPELTIPLPTGPLGQIILPVTWPAGLPSGFELYYQFWITDGAGPAGLAASNGLSGTTP